MGKRACGELEIAHNGIFFNVVQTSYSLNLFDISKNSL